MLRTLNSIDSIEHATAERVTRDNQFIHLDVNFVTSHSVTAIVCGVRSILQSLTRENCGDSVD